MHAAEKDRLEEYLSGSLEPAALDKLEAHLKTCEACRQEVEAMQEFSQCMAALRPAKVPEPAPDFYARVMQRIGRQSAALTISNLFNWQFAFARRLAFAALVTFAILGSYLIMHENAYPSGLSPEAVMAQQESPAFESGPGPDNMLVSLTAYEQH
jgi:anti-sigma factor RsiW